MKWIIVYMFLRLAMGLNASYMRISSISIYSASLCFMAVLLLANCSDNEIDFTNSGYLEIDGIQMELSNESLRVGYNDLSVPAEDCQSKYLEFIFLISPEKNTLWYLSLIGPAMDNGFLAGEYPISINCNGALNFISTAKILTESVSCLRWDDINYEYYWDVCDAVISNEDYYFQGNSFFHELSGQGVLKILTLDQITKYISLEIDIDADFAKDSISNSSVVRKTITAQYKGTYVEDGGLIKVPWQLREQLRDPCINPDNPYDINPIKQTMVLDIYPNGEVHFTGAIEMEDLSAAECYENKVLFKMSTISAYDFDGSFHIDNTYIDQLTVIDFTKLAENKFIVTGDLNSLLLGKEYIIVFKSIYFVKGFQEGEMLEYESSIITYYKIKDTAYTCFNNAAEYVQDCRWN